MRVGPVLITAQQDNKTCMAERPSDGLWENLYWGINYAQGEDNIVFTNIKVKYPFQFFLYF